MTTTANDLTDRQWAAAYVIDQAPVAFDPLAETSRVLADAANSLVIAPYLLAEFARIARELDALTTIREQRELLTRIARGEA